MSNYSNSSCNGSVSRDSLFIGNATKNIEICKDITATELRADLKVDSLGGSIRLWGQITDCDGNPVQCALIKLVKETIKQGKKQYVGIAHSVSDCLGFYQFEICIPECNCESYKVIVSKQLTGQEIVIDPTGNGECDPCNGGKNCSCAK